MQKITINGTTYTLSPSRDISKVIKAAKAKPKMTRQKQDARFFPPFFAGKTSTADYIGRYWQANNHDTATFWAFYGPFCDESAKNPAPVYDPSEPECETLTEGGEA